MPTASEPTLSVVLPNYNHAACLPQALRAMIGQSRPPLEIILIDDASTDNSLEVIQSFCAQYPVVRLHRNAENHGVVYNMNLGLEMARGRYVCFAGADDQMLPGFFERSLGLLAKHPEAGMCSGICEWRDHQYGYTWHVGAGLGPNPAFFSPDDLVRLQLAGTLNLPTNSVIFRTDALKAIRGFNPALKWHCDWMAIQLVAFQHGTCYYPGLFAIFNINPKSYSQGTRSQLNRQVLSAMLDLLLRDAPSEARDRIIRSGALSSFGLPMLRLILGQSQYRPFLNTAFLRQNLWYINKVTVRKFLPAFLAKWYYRIFFRAKG
jgi:glycosyltransferase involved in cell wall biosynthesis